MFVVVALSPLGRICYTGAMTLATMAPQAGRYNNMMHAGHTDCFDG